MSFTRYRWDGRSRECPEFEPIVEYHWGWPEWIMVVTLAVIAAVLVAELW